MTINKIIKNRVLLLMGLMTLGQLGRAQTNMYVTPTGTFYTDKGAQVAIFGDLINDAKGGFNHNGGGTVYLYRDTVNGTGSSQVKDGPSAPAFTGDFNTGGAYVRIFNLVTDNKTGTASASGTQINTTSGSGHIEIRQEVRVTGQHTFTNGMVWTPRGNWKHAFMHYEDTSKYTGAAAMNAMGKHIDGYAAYTGTANFIFPIGDGVYNRQSGLVAPASGTYRSAYFKKDATAGTSGISGNVASTTINSTSLLAKVSTKEFWDIDGTASSKFSLSSLNSQAYSAWSSEFSGYTIGDTIGVVVAAFDPWENLSIYAKPGSFSADGMFSSLLASNPGSVYSAYTWAIGKFNKLTPDVNVAPKGVTIPGNMTTNDVVLAGTNYGTPVAVGTNPSSATPVMNADGSYTFSATTPGVYTYAVPACPPGQTTDCPTELLTITVTNPADTTTSVPVANTDLASTKGTTPVTSNVKSNDGSLNTNGTLATKPTIVNPPKNGTAVVNADGTITYTANAGFIGTDTLTYQICDMAVPPGCTQALMIVNVLPSDAPNSVSASDDYASTKVGVPVTGNVLTNDIDPDGNTLSVTPSTTTNSQGTFAVTATGAYTFTPLPGFTGPASFTYDVCDNATPTPACTKATAYFIVKELGAFLDIKVSKFEAEVFDCGVNIIWQVTSTEDASHINLKKSYEGTDYTVIYRKDVIGTSSSLQTFSYQDNDPEVRNRTVHYLLEMVDLDGSKDYSAPIQVTTHCTGSNTNAVSVYPNPSNDVFTVKFMDFNDSEIELRVYNVVGQEILNQQIQLTNGINQTNVDLGAYSSGQYILSVKTLSGIHEQIKLIKK